MTEPFHVPPSEEEADEWLGINIASGDDLVGQPELHLNLLQVLTAYPYLYHDILLCRLIKANASLDIIKEVTKLCDSDPRFKSHLQEALMYADEETVLYIAEQFPEEISCSYPTMWMNTRDRGSGGNLPLLSLAAWTKLISIIPENDEEFQVELIEAAFGLSVHPSVLGLLLDNKCPDRIEILDFAISSVGSSEYGELFGKILPRVQTLRCHEQCVRLGDPDPGMTAFWNALPPQGQLKLLHISAGFPGNPVLSACKAALSTNRSIQELHLHFYKIVKPPIKDFQKGFDLVAEAIRNMPQLSTLYLSGEIVFDNVAYVSKQLEQMALVHTGLENLFLRGAYTGSAPLVSEQIERIHYFLWLNAAGRGQVRSKEDMSVSQLLNLLPPLQANNPEGGVWQSFNVVYGLLREKPAIWSAHCCGNNLQNPAGGGITCSIGDHQSKKQKTNK